MATQKLRNEYKIKVVNPNPRLKIVDMFNQYTDEQLKKFIKNQSNCICDTSICNVIKIWLIKKNNMVFQAVLEVDT